MSRHVDALTGLRGLAAAWVLVYHAWVLAAPRRMTLSLGDLGVDLTPFFSAGWAGVQMFFVLSGFLLALPFARWQAGLASPPVLGRYLMRRVRRVFPAYYAQALLLATIAWLSTGRWPLDTWANCLRHLTMLFVPLPLAGEALNGIWWSLPVEFMFYLLLPLVALLLRPSRAILLLVGALGCMALWRYAVAVLMADEPIARRFMVGSQLPGVMDSFGLGMIGAVLQVHRTRLPRLDRLLLTSWAPALAAVVIVACLYWIHTGFRGYWVNSPIFYLWTPAFGLALLVIVLASAGGNELTRLVLGNKVVVFIGTISYSIYLWHMPLLDAVRARLALGAYEGYMLLPLLAAALLLVLPASWLSWWLVEQRFIRAANAG